MGEQCWMSRLWAELSSPGHHQKWGSGVLGRLAVLQKPRDLGGPPTANLTDTAEMEGAFHLAPRILKIGRPRKFSGYAFGENPAPCRAARDLRSISSSPFPSSSSSLPLICWMI